MPTVEQVEATIARAEAAQPTGEEGAPVETPAPVVETPAPAPAAEVAPAADPFDNAETKQFERAYVERVRGEAAEARTKLKTYEDLDKLDSTKRDAWLRLARTMESDPAQAYKWLDEIVQAAKTAPGTPETPAPTAPGGTDYLTRQDMIDMLGQRDAEAAEQRMIADVHAELKAAGLDYESSDPVEVATAIAVMKVAAEVTGGDMKAAYKLAVEDPRQKAIDEYVAKKAATAGTPGSSAAPGAIPSTERTRPADIDPMRWASMMAKERIQARQA